MKIPSTVGVTGQVFRTGVTCVSQNATKNSKFNADVDNLAA